MTFCKHAVFPGAFFSSRRVVIHGSEIMIREGRPRFGCGFGFIGRGVFPVMSLEEMADV